MFEGILNYWKRLLLLREERCSLFPILFLCSEKFHRLEMPIVPFFMMIDEKRWCQPSV
jgi:hypothetical protein